MNSTTFHQSQLKSTSNSVASNSSRERGLVATWVKVNGKLVCTWSNPNSKELSKSVESDRMTHTTIDQSPIQPASLTVVSTNPRKKRLIAQWVTIDGKLVCKWITQEPSALSQSSKMSISQPKAA